MQTFLPYADFQKTAEVLDYRRLGKQRVECKQILKAMGGGAWSNHPATKMWRGYEECLKLYANTIIREWVRRGYKNTMPYYEVGEVIPPPWLGNEEFHRSHRSNLLRKDFSYYSQYFNEDPTLEYVWP